MSDRTAAPLTSRLVDALYIEALLLADELRAYLDGDAGDDRAALGPLDRVGFACESLNASTRLMQLLSALLARRAGLAGEGELATPPAPPLRALDRLPVEARRLIAAGVDLAERVRRLDGVPVAAPPSPARALLQRLERSL